MQYNCCVKSVVSITVDYCVSQKIRTPNWIFFIEKYKTLGL